MAGRKQSTSCWSQIQQETSRIAHPVNEGGVDVILDIPTYDSEDDGHVSYDLHDRSSVHAPSRHSWKFLCDFNIVCVLSSDVVWINDDDCNVW